MAHETLHMWLSESHYVFDWWCRGPWVSGVEAFQIFTRHFQYCQRHCPWRAYVNRNVDGHGERYVLIDCKIPFLVGQVQTLDAVGHQPWHQDHHWLFLSEHHFLCDQYARGYFSEITRSQASFHWDQYWSWASLHEAWRLFRTTDASRFLAVPFPTFRFQ